MKYWKYCFYLQYISFIGYQKNVFLFLGENKLNDTDKKCESCAVGGHFFYICLFFVPFEKLIKFVYKENRKGTLFNFYHVRKTL